MFSRKSKPGPEAFDATLKPEKDLADAAVLLELIASGSLRTDKPLFAEKRSCAKRLDAEQEQELAHRIKTWGDIDARNTLVMANLGLVHMIVNQMLRPHLRYEDLLQEGMMGLIRATETFQADRSIRFSTYGVFWIRAKMQRFIQSHEKDRKPISFDQTNGEDGSLALSETFPSDIEDPERLALRSERTTAVRDIFAKIVQDLKNPRLKAIIDRRILAEDPETLEQLGEHLNISRESARLLESKMLKLAREQLANWR